MKHAIVVVAALLVGLPAYAEPVGKAKAAPKAADAEIINRAKAAVAAKLKDPASARFEGLDRAMRRNVNGTPMDSICGFVNAKNSYGGYTGPKPFLYLVKDGDAYIADGQDAGGVVARMIYNNFCVDGAK